MTKTDLGSETGGEGLVEGGPLSHSTQVTRFWVLGFGFLLSAFCFLVSGFGFWVLGFGLGLDLGLYLGLLYISGFWVLGFGLGTNSECHALGQALDILRIPLSLVPPMNP